MEEKRVEGWEEFAKSVAELVAQRDGGDASLLFRGQADARWALKTTWETNGYRNISMLDYASHALVLKDEIEILVNQKWQVNPNELAGLFEDQNLIIRFLDAPINGFDYLSYLRQHGFPSPFLDWSRSKFVAAFFAFQTSAIGADNVAIYVFNKSKRRVKSAGAFPSIFPILARNGGHRRHFMQQGVYTLCLDWRDDCNGDARWYISSHESADAAGDALQGDSVITKFILPSRERSRVLDMLDEQNINAYTLFGNEEGIMQTLANRQLKNV